MFQDSGFAIQNLELDAPGWFEREGFQVINSVIAFDACEMLAAEFTLLFDEQQKTAGTKIGGVRNLLYDHSLVSQLANSQNIVSVLQMAAGLPLFPIRAIFFDKNPESNWLVPWHQDLAIPVVARIDTPGFTGWSIKDGVPHVHPPREILECMVALRLHLDDCPAENGALKVIPGSHRYGKLSANEISKCVQSNEAVVCGVPKGGALLIRPLLLHASLPATNPTHRRVLHVEYASRSLPNGLKWFEY
ncbi:MAG: phytanoyl-CoA dioxygenase family protein [Verrucomicrobiota bacterium]